MIIVGAGLAGLLAGNMLHHRQPLVVERQAALPNNHSAVLRFRSSIIGDLLNIPFKKVTMIKANVTWRNPIADALAYAFKNVGEYRSDRSITAGLTTAERWVAPRNLIQRMAEPLDIKFGTSAKFNAAGAIISTIPMPALMAILGYHTDDISFNYSGGTNIKATIDDCDAYISLLVPDPKLNFSRISITGSELTIESAKEAVTTIESELMVSVAAELLGINAKNMHDITVHQSVYAKINPIDDAARKNFLYWATDKHNIYSLGRFATWRPGLLLDDLVHDIQKINGWINTGKYAIARER